MRIRPKTIRRLTLLAIIVVLIGALGVGAVFFRRVQRHNSIAALRTQALADYAAGKHEAALPQLAQSVRYNKDDPEVLLALARSRRAVETGDGSYLLQAANAMRAYRLLEPNDLPAAQELLELYTMIGANPEADALSKELLDRRQDLTPEQIVRVKLARASALQGINPADREAEALLKDAAQSSPSNFEAQRRYVGTLLQANPAEACEYAASLTASNADPRLAVLQLIACDQDIGDGKSPTRETLQAIKQIFTEVDDAALADDSFIGAALAVATQTRDSGLALTVLKRAAESPAAGKTWPVLYVRRLYELDRFAQAASEAERLLSKADPSDVADLQAYALLGRRAAAEGQSGGPDAQEFAVLAEKIKAEGGSTFRSKGWNLALIGIAALDDNKPVFAEEKLTEATKAYPAEPVIRLMLGDALSRLERGESARATWREARGVAGSPWPAAELRIVRSLVRSGQTRAALDAATEAMISSPDRVTVYLGWLTACGGLLERGLATAEDRRLANDIIVGLDTSLDGADASVQEAIERTVLPVRLALALSEEVDPDVTSLLNRPQALAALRDQQVASQVASLLVSAGRDVPTVVAANLDQESRPDARLAMARALQLAREGNSADGAALLQTPPGGDDRLWAIDRAQFAERIAADPSEERAAATKWVELFKKYPDDLDVIDAVLRSGTAPYDAALIESAAAALAKLTNATGSAPPAQVVLARAQAVRLGNPTAKQRDAAIGSLEQLISQEPTNLQAHIVVAGLYTMDNPASKITPEPTRAAEHLLTASELIGGNAADSFRLQGASLFQMTRDFDSARDALFRMLDGTEDPDPTLLWNAGLVLLAQGEPELALRLLARAEAQIEEARKPSLLVDIARAREGMADDDGAGQLFRQATDLGLKRPGEVLVAAAFFARTQQDEYRERAASALDEMDLPVGVAELTRARLAAQAMDVDQAEQWYQESLDRNPQSPGVWAELAQLRLNAGNAAGAESAISGGLKLFPDDMRLRVLQRQAQAAAAGGGGDVDLNALAEVFSQNDETARVGQATKAIAELQASGKLGDRQALIDVARKYPDVLPLQTLVGRRLMDSDIGAYADAAELMMRAAEYFPAEAEPARLATVAYATLGSYDRMQAAALLWRRRDPTQARAADLAIAESAFELKQMGRASDLVGTYLQSALAKPGDGANLRLLQLWVRISAQQGTLNDVQARLAPLLSGDAGPVLLTSVWLPAVADTIPDWATAQAWLDLAEPLATGPELTARLVDACRYRAEQGLPDIQAVIQRAVRSADQIRSSTDPAILTTLAELDRLRHDLLREEGAAAEADSLARSAIALMRQAADATDPVSGAQRLVRAGSIAETIPDLNEAIACYRAALTASEAPAQLLAIVHNNLAFCLQKRGNPGDADEAKAEIDRAIAIVPLAPFLHTKGKILEAQGKPADAIAAFREGLRLEPEHLATLAALAAELAAGDATARQEAEGLLQRADTLSRTSASPEIVADLAKARRLLAD